jgi:signal transduction histidine kinase
MREIVLHLIGEGCRDFAAITGPALNDDSRERLEALEATLAENGLRLAPEKVIRGTYWKYCGEEGVRILLDQRKASFDALVVFNDVMAVPALAELRRRGIDVPGRVKVSGFDDNYEAFISEPPLTTASYSISGLGEASVDIAASLLAGRQVPALTLVKPRLEVRESTAGKRDATPSPRTAGQGEFAMGRRLLEVESIVKGLEEMSESLHASLRVDELSRIVSRFGPRIKVDTCFVVVYADRDFSTASLIARVEGGEALPCSDFGPFPTRELLPPRLLEAYPGLAMEPLYVKDEDIGYMLFNNGDFPGIVYKSLRHQVASFIKASRLFEAVKEYSAGLERMVNERTGALLEANETLKREISLREAAEKELLKKMNLESLALLAGGIAHDFNNFLTAISGNAEILDLSGDDPGLRKELLAGIAGAVSSATALTGQLLTFAKGGYPIKSVVSLGPMVEGAATFMLRGSPVKPEFDLEPGLKNVEIDVGQITQVLNNLLINAIQAMPGGGRIKIAARRASVPPDGIPGLAPGDYARVSIEDSGTGIAPGIIERIFDPYFTTKEKGSGLGLSTSLAIVKRHAGTLTVRSEPGKGSVFDFYLPTTEKGEKREASGADEKIPGGKRILFLEDNAEIGDVIVLFADSIGAAVTATSEGGATVEAYGAAMRSGMPYDLVLTDLTIPGGMGGREAMEAIIKMDPRARGIVMSGYSDGPVMENFRDFGFRMALRKPFSLKDFKRAVREALAD